MRLVSNDDWTFCSLIPESPVNGNSGGKVYGLGPANDDLAPYMLAFANNDDKYQVLSMCIYEVLDYYLIPSIGNINILYFRNMISDHFRQNSQLLNFCSDVCVITISATLGLLSSII